MLTGKPESTNRVGVTEFAWSKSLRKGDWRLVYYPKDMFAKEYPDGFGELYNVEEDPWEMNNRFFEAADQAKVRELQLDLMDWLITTTRPTTVHGAELSADLTAQNSKHYGHVVNRDNKMHFDRVKTAAKHPGYRHYQ